MGIVILLVAAFCTTRLQLLALWTVPTVIGLATLPGLQEYQFKMGFAVAEFWPSVFATLAMNAALITAGRAARWVFSKVRARDLGPFFGV